MTWKEEVGLRLARLRTKAGLTRPELSKLIRYSEGSIYTWETGRTAMSIDTLRAYCRVFKTTSDYILFGLTKGERNVKTL